MRVPLRVSASTFTHRADSTDAADIRASVDTWIARQLTGVYGFHPKTAHAIVADGRVLPIIDGLDEMDPDNSPPRRAAQLLVALNLCTRGVVPEPVVLTCRTAHYRHLNNDVEGFGGHLQDATTVVMQPLEVDEVVARLTHQFPHPDELDLESPTRIHHRWQRVVTTINNRPNGRLATCLRSPLRLYMAMTVYADPTSTPADLCALSADDLTLRLLDELVPAATKHHLRPGHGRFEPADVERWLSTLANHLALMARLGHSNTDIHLHQLWRTTGKSPGRIRHAVTAVTASLAIVPPLVFAAKAVMSHPPNIELLVFSITIMAALTFLTFRSGRPNLDRPPRRLDMKGVFRPATRRKITAWTRRYTKRGLLFGTILGALGGGALWWIGEDPLLFLWPGMSICISLGVFFGFCAGTLEGLLATISQPHQVAVKPSGPPRDTLAWMCVTRLAMGLAGGIMAGLFFGALTTFFPGPAMTGTGPWGRFLFGFGVGIGAGLCTAILVFVVIIVFGGGYNAYSPWSHYLVTAYVHARAGSLPRQLGLFLDWAHTAGLLRMAGTAVQFRHRELQTHLTTVESASTTCQ